MRFYTALAFAITTVATPAHGAPRQVPGEWIVKQRGKFSLVRARIRPPQSQPNYIYRASTSDPDYAKSWGLKNSGQALSDFGPGIAGKDIRAEEAWNFYDGANPVTVAVLDSGIDRDHAELRRALWKNPGEIPGNFKDDDGNGFVDDVYGWNFVSGNADTRDDNNHGSFCAGIIAAEADNGVGSRGVSRGARIMPVKMLDKQGQGTTASAIAAIEYAVKNGATVINASWGGVTYDPALYEAVKDAGRKGVLFIAAAGNDGQNNDGAENPIYPAAFRLPTILTVAAYNNRDELAHWSNFGRETVHLGAPGVEIYSTTVGGYKLGEGTSYAAPFVTGVAALVKSHTPALTMGELRDRLLWTSEPMHYYEMQKLFTGGRVNAYNALTNFRPPRPAVPTHWSSYGEAVETVHPYANNTKETYRLYRQGAKHVRAHFVGFDTEECCDRVILRDGSGKLVTEYSGKHGDFWSADALGDTLVVEFISDFSMPAHGFGIDKIEVSYD